jgi:hypothetical protein
MLALAASTRKKMMNAHEALRTAQFTRPLQAKLLNSRYKNAGICLTRANSPTLSRAEASRRPSGFFF